MLEKAPGIVPKPPSVSADGHPFVDPPWSAPLDAGKVLAGVPKDATVSGMFFTFLVVGAKEQGFVLPSARDRYTQFSFYPLSELAGLVVEATARLFPKRTFRHALRVLGRSSPNAFLASTLGKVTLGSTEGVLPAIEALANGYQVNVRPSAVTVTASAANWAVVRMERVYYFLDSHHVGVLEGLLQFAGAKGKVLVASRTADSADLLLTW